MLFDVTQKHHFSRCVLLLFFPVSYLSRYEIGTKDYLLCTFLNDRHLCSTVNCCLLRSAMTKRMAGGVRLSLPKGIKLKVMY